MTVRSDAAIRFRILLVEDNDLDYRSICRALDAAGEAHYEIERAPDFGGALSLLRDGMFDCVLLDLSLPDSEGLVSVDTIVRMTPETPVVVLTGLEDPTTAVEAVQRGAEDYLLKREVTPVLADRAIRYAIARHHHESELRTANEMLDLLHDRERIARDLHDTVIQRLFATGMSLQATASKSSDPLTRGRMIDAVDEIDEAIRVLREAIFGLHQVSTGGSLAAQLSDVVTSQVSQLGFVPNLRLGDLELIGDALAHELLAVLTEALSNVARHANATAAEVVVEVISEELVLSVLDNGVGLPATPTRDASGRTGHGIDNMASRARQLSGTLTIRPGTGGGVALEWRVPLGL